MIYDGDAVSHAVGFVHVVRGQDDGLDAGQGADVFAHLDAALRVQSGFRLVQHDDVGVVHQSQRQVEPPLHSAGKRVRLPVALFGQVQLVEQLLAPRQRLAAGQPVHLADELQLLKTSQSFPDDNVLWAHAHAGAHVGPAAGNRRAVHHNATRVWLEQPTHHVDRSGLACAVRAEQAEHFTFTDLQTQVLHRHQ